ncbi:MAG TPA: hypothetical protein VJN62_12825 [Gemmatimonadales bacterium]|nr:hypothetical protein [Gemmatimonadales bacterium]
MNRAFLAVLLLGVLSACRKGNTAPGAQDMAGALISVPDTGVPLAVYQRYKFQHQQLDSMRLNLLSLVTAEKGYFADSGKYTTTTSCRKPPTEGTAAWCASRNNTLGPIHVTQNGWWTTITNLNLPIFCAIQVGDDTTFGAPAGVPACFGAHAGPAPY